jgi:NAD-dependent SIR2 family protein deacetylase
MPLYARRSGANIVIINMGDTGQNDIADVLINAPAGDVMTKVMEKLKSIIRE